MRDDETSEQRDDEERRRGRGGVALLPSATALATPPASRAHGGTHRHSPQGRGSEGREAAVESRGLEFVWFL
jgi:hypothetical protein